MAYMHIGKDFVPPDVNGKVTGRIKYAEDYTREGMVLCASTHQSNSPRACRKHRRIRSTRNGRRFWSSHGRRRLS